MHDNRIEGLMKIKLATLGACALSSVACIAAQVAFLGDGYTKGLLDDAAWRDGFFSGGKYEAVNLAADGETSESLIKRVDAGLLDGTDAKAVVLAVGANDFRRDGVYALDLILNVQALLDKIRARMPSAKVVLCPVWPQGSGFDDPMRRKGDATVIPIRDFQNGTNVLWCNVTSKFVKPDGSPVAEMYAGNERLSSAGYAAWTKELKRYLDFALGYVDKHPYPQLGLAPMFPDEKKYVLEGRARFKRYFLTAKDQRRYRVKLDEVRSRNLKEYDAVWVGDSITHFWELRNGKPTFDRLYSKEYEILNLGFGGDSTRDCLWTILHSGLYEGWKAKAIWLMLGTNNFPKNASDGDIANTAKAMKRIVAVLREKHPESKILLLPALPRGREKESPYRAIHEKYNRLIREQADGRDVIWVGELYGKFCPDGGDIPKDVLCDGVHPGKTGYRIFGEAMLPYMRRFCGTGLKAAAREAYPVAKWRGTPKTYKMDGTADGKYRAVELFQKEPSPIVVRFAGEAGNPMERAAARLMLDVHYATGADPHEWGNRLWLDFSTPGRKEREFVFYPSRPVRHLAAYVNGQAACKPKMEPIAVETFEPSGDAVLDGIPVVGAAPVKSGFYVRDAEAESGYASITNAGSAKGVALSATCEKSGNARFFTAEIRDVTGSDRAMTLLYAVPLPEGGLTWFDDTRRSRMADSAKRAEFCNALGGESARGPLSKWPLAAVSAGDRGVAIGVDPELPGFCRLALNPRLRVLYVAYDIGLAAPEKPSGRVGFVVFPFAAKDGMRGALERYQSLFPEHNRDRAKPHGLWSAFYKLSNVTNVQDFGFRYNESGRELAWDDANDILSLRYREPCTWWMKIAKPDGSGPSYMECLAKAKEELVKGVPDARAWETSVFKDEGGWPAGMILNKSWCNGIAWSMNAAPGISGLSEFLFKQGSAEDCAKRYAKPKPEGWDGEYIDSAELYCTMREDFDRRHFAAMRTPLVYSADRKRPCVYSGLCVQEYMAEVHRRMLAADRISLANATPYRWSWLVPQTDVAGYEIDWCAEGKWKPTPEEQLVHKRALAGVKPYCLLMEIHSAAKFTPEMTERYFKLSLAYGFLPGFQASLFKTGVHERDRGLFKRYVPLCKLVSEAGWRPVNRLVSTDTPDVRIEQFGESYVTVFNHGDAEAAAELRLLRGGAAKCKDLVLRRSVAFVNGAARASLLPGDVMLLEMQSPE